MSPESNQYSHTNKNKLNCLCCLGQRSQFRPMNSRHLSSNRFQQYWNGLNDHKGQKYIKCIIRSTGLRIHAALTPNVVKINSLLKERSRKATNTQTIVRTVPRFLSKASQFWLHSPHQRDPNKFHKFRIGLNNQKGQIYKNLHGL